MNSLKKQVVYILAQIDRIGQLAGEMFYLRNLYEESKFDLTVISYPPEFMPRTNIATYRISTRGVNVLHSIDDRLIWYTHNNRSTDRIGLFNYGDIAYYLLPPDNIAPDFMLKYKNRTPIHPFRLTEEEIEKGQLLSETFQILKDAPIVTMHVREGGYLPHLSYHSYRDSEVKNYVPAIEFLISEGYYVVRIGDKSMKPLQNLPEQFIDAPFHPAYCDLVEPFFISQSRFFISTGSGPHALAQGFGIPVLQTNQPILAAIWGEKDDVIIHKRYYSHERGRALSYSEVLLSPVMDFYETGLYKNVGLELFDNTSEEILIAVKEMHERLNDTYWACDEVKEVNDQVQAIRKKANEYRAEKCADTVYPFLPCYWHNVQISNEFAKANPYFLECRLPQDR
ncbi:TIGR04372 family glycosyltransferase [bacterium]|nr:TIGR04372 family glycosyltransferase [bacterium]